MCRMQFTRREAKREEVLGSFRRELNQVLPILRDRMTIGTHVSTVSISIGLAAMLEASQDFRKEAIQRTCETLGVPERMVFFVIAGSASAIGVKY